MKQQETRFRFLLTLSLLLDSADRAQPRNQKAEILSGKLLKSRTVGGAGITVQLNLGVHENGGGPKGTRKKPITICGAPGVPYALIFDLPGVLRFESVLFVGDVLWHQKGERFSLHVTVLAAQRDDSSA